LYEAKCAVLSNVTQLNMERIQKRKMRATMNKNHINHAMITNTQTQTKALK